MSTTFFQRVEDRPVPVPFSRLSSRELQTAIGIISGARYKEIAAQYDLSPKTIDTYRNSIYRKLKVDSEVELAYLAIACGLITVPVLKNESEALPYGALEVVGPRQESARDVVQSRGFLALMQAVKRVAELSAELVEEFPTSFEPEVDVELPTAKQTPVRPTKAA